MPATKSEVEVIPDETQQQPASHTTTTARSQNKPKRQPPYAVVLHNDDINGMDYVVAVLRKVFNYGRMKAVWLMMKAHTTGRSIVWTGSREVAELKAEQLKSCGPDPNMKNRGAGSLRVTVEPLPD
jgi:ATP-dependent Clp protease adaptor protein ClpS